VEIQSAFNAGVQGFQKATETVTQEATNIAESVAIEDATAIEASATTPETESADSNTDSTLASSSNDTPDLNQSLVNLKVAEYQAKASVEVIKTADENLGTLLDVSV